MAASVEWKLIAAAEEHIVVVGLTVVAVAAAPCTADAVAEMQFVVVTVAVVADSLSPLGSEILVVVGLLEVVVVGSFASLLL